MAASESDFTKTLEQIHAITGDRNSEVFRRFLEISFCALSYGQREDQYLKAIAPFKNKREVLDLYVEAFSTMVNDYEQGPLFKDHLGDTHMELSGTRDKQAKGEFYTPEHVCDMMAQMANVSHSATEKPIRFHEPAAGSGRMILSAAKVLVEDGGSPSDMWVEAWDVGQMPFWMCFINLSLWCIPARVIRGNTLSNEIFDEQLTMATFLPKPKPRPENEKLRKQVTLMQEVLNEIVSPEAPTQPQPLTLGKKAEQTSLF